MIPLRIMQTQFSRFVLCDNTVYFFPIVAAATIFFSAAIVRRLFEGDYYFSGSDI